MSRRRPSPSASPSAVRAALAALALTSALARTSPAQEPAPLRPVQEASVEVDLPAEVDLDAPTVLRAAAKALGRELWVDPQVAQTRVAFTRADARPLAWAALRTILEQLDVVVVDGGGVLRAHHRRNLTVREGPPWRLVPPDAIPEGNELVTTVVPLANPAAGQATFALVRGLLTRDPNRVGNVLYAPGAEVIVIADLAPQVRFYVEVIRQLDCAPRDVAARAFELARADPHEVARALERLLGSPAQPTPGVGAPGLRVVADPRTRQVAVSGRAELVEAAAVLVRALDVPDAGEAPTLHAFPVRGDPAEVAGALAATLQALERLARGPAPGVVVHLPGERVGVVCRPADAPRIAALLKQLAGE